MDTKEQVLLEKFYCTSHCIDGFWFSPHPPYINPIVYLTTISMVPQRSCPSLQHSVFLKSMKPSEPQFAQLENGDKFSIIHPSK